MKDKSYGHPFRKSLSCGHFLFTFRTFGKNLIYGIINLLGLTLGLAVAVLIFFFVQDEISYDKFFPGYDRVARIQPTVTKGAAQQTWATSEGFIATAIQNTYPEVETFTKVLRMDEPLIIKTGAHEFLEGYAIAADSAFFSVFSIPFIHGDPATSLQKPDGIVISKAVAGRWFGEQEPAGQTVLIDGSAVVVTGVFDDLPPTSHLQFTIVLPLRAIWPDADQSRNMYAFYSYLKLRSPNDIETLSAKLLSDWQKLYGYNMAGQPAPPGFSTRLNLMPVSSIHLESKAEKEFGVNGSIQMVYLFAAVACLILVIVVINYINLSNAVALKRVREIAVRKMMGASRGKIFYSFVSETHLLTLLAIGSSMAVVAVLMPRFNMLTGKHFEWPMLFNVPLLTFLSALWLLLSALSGIYPATMLSSFKPVEVMKSGISIAKGGQGMLFFRRGLLVFQFAISALLMVMALTVWKQMNLINTTNTGFNKENVLVVATKGQPGDKIQAFKEEVTRLGNVESASFTSAVPGKRIVFLTVRIPELEGSNGDQDKGIRNMRVLAVDEDFVQTMRLEIKEGRDFSRVNSADVTSAFLLNEAAVKEFNLDNPVGRPFEYVFGETKKGQIVGIVKDFSYASVHSKVEPLMIHLLPWYSFLCIRLHPGHTVESVKAIDLIWKQTSSSPFTYSFLDQTYDSQYKSEQITAELMTYFTVLALLFATLGLFGIVTFFVTQRTKEVCIRKVFGATRLSLLKELSREYLVIVCAGNLIAFYPAWWLARQWLEKFVVRTELSPKLFVFTLLISLTLAVAVILNTLIKTASTNAAVVLRNE